MFKSLKKRIKNEKGLTLVELLAVVVILAIIAVIAIPAIGNIIENSRVKAAKADVANVVSAANLYFAEYNTVDTFTVGGNNPSDNADQFISDLGTITTLTVTKGTDGKLTFGGQGQLTTNKGYTIEDGTDLETLQVDKGDVDDDNFTIVEPEN